MLINFVGAPCSGKTTTAASLFATLKEDGHITEFIPEQARHYIAETRYRRGLKASDSLKLDMSDQMEIMKRQNDLELYMTESCGKHGFVISDSSNLNSFLYMSDELLAQYQTNRIPSKLQDHLDFMRNRVSIVFVCSIVKPVIPHDPNRIHSTEESFALQQKVDGILTLLPEVPVVRLLGDYRSRHQQALTEIYTRC